MQMYTVNTHTLHITAPRFCLTNVCIYAYCLDGSGLPFTTTIHINHSQQPFTTTIHNNHSQQPFTTTIHNNHSQQPFTTSPADVPCITGVRVI